MPVRWRLWHRVGRFSNLLATYALWWRLLALVERQSRFWCQSAKVGLTYPSLLGIEETRRHLARQQETARDILGQFGPRAAPLTAVVEMLAGRDK